jgi:CheY-like chemotaxis protein
MNDKAPELKILVVEDEDSKIVEWSDAIAYHNADLDTKGFLIQMVVAKSLASAKEQLNMHRIDAAVVDLRLQVEPGVAENNSEGNEVVKYILATQPLGVAVYTGQQADADIAGYSCPQVTVMDKGDGLDQVFVWLGENKDLFFSLRSAKNTFNRETAKLFFRSIWPRWSRWATPSVAGVDLTEVVARHIVAHVHDSLLNSAGDATHPEEAYFVPPLKDRLDTGDLVEYEDKTWVVVTPRCDLANEGKVDTILLAYCADISAKWAELYRADNARSVKEVKKLIQHDGMPKQHFLHPMRDISGSDRGPWMVQFHNLKAIPAADAVRDLGSLRFASISPLFVPSLVERFGAYFSRIGTPGYSSD